MGVFAWAPRAGQAKEGFWGEGEGRLYRFYFTPAELGALMREAGFKDVTLRGFLILPGRITKYLPASLAFVETWFSRILPPVSGVTRYLLAAGRR